MWAPFIMNKGKEGVLERWHRISWMWRRFSLAQGLPTLSAMAFLLHRAEQHQAYAKISNLSLSLYIHSPPHHLVQQFPLKVIISCNYDMLFKRREPSGTVNQYEA